MVDYSKWDRYVSFVFVKPHHHFKKHLHYTLPVMDRKAKRPRHSLGALSKKSDTVESRLELSDDSDIEVHRTSNLSERSSCGHYRMRELKNERD